ncbi:hypothetical protein BGX27_006362 [Mortierella sp. AM989]|nr:hypothetical protein BGX27_006362 [Mortierella sp. AM989]
MLCRPGSGVSAELDYSSLNDTTTRQKRLRRVSDIEHSSLLKTPSVRSHSPTVIPVESIDSPSAIQRSQPFDDPFQNDAESEDVEDGDDVDDDDEDDDDSDEDDGCKVP